MYSSYELIIIMYLQNVENDRKTALWVTTKSSNLQ